MRTALLGILVVACSSPAKPITTSPDEPPILIDAAPVASIAPDAAPPGPCLPVRTYVDTMVGTTAKVCNEPEFGGEADGCFAVTPDGAVAPWTVEEAATSYAELDDRSVKACGPVGNCTMITPGLGKTLRVVSAAIDPAGARVVLVLHDGKTGTAGIELWDVATKKRIARGDLKVSAPERVYYDAQLLGEAILVTADVDDTWTGTLWRVAGAKLTQLPALTGDLGDVVDLGDGRAAMVFDQDRVVIIDLTSGAELGTVDWGALRPGDGQPTWLFLAAPDGGPFGIAASTSNDGSAPALGAVGSDLAAVPYPAVICPE